MNSLNVVKKSKFIIGNLPNINSRCKIAHVFGQARRDEDAVGACRQKEKVVRSLQMIGSSVRRNKLLHWRPVFGPTPGFFEFVSGCCGGETVGVLSVEEYLFQRHLVFP